MKVSVAGIKNLENSTELFHNFLNYLQSELPLTEDIKIVLSSNREGNMTTGVREPNEMRVLVGNRLLIDILRTIAHEWVHEYQNQRMGVPDDIRLPEIGGPVENMASVLASIFLKKFQKRYSKFEKQLYGEY